MTEVIDSGALPHRLVALLEAREGEVVRGEDLIAGLAVSWARPFAQLQVVICRARDALPAGVEILTIQGQGYMLRRR